MTRVDTIAEVHEAIEGARNVIHVIVLFPNAGYSDIQKSDTKEVSVESTEEIYEQARELEIEKDLESDNKVELPLQTHTKRRQQELPRWKRVSGFGKVFQWEEPSFRESLSDLEGNSPYQV